MYQKGDMVDLELPEWLADREGLDTRFVEGEVKAVTQKAILVEMLDGSELWVPLSEVE